ncbi:MAG TPA: ATP-binding protein [Pyrinomonadaceae bacterium]|nr:ATP-binding protein [Pyrinomonadaceae bacterium]
MENLENQTEGSYLGVVEQNGEVFWRLEFVNPISVKLPFEEQVKLLYQSSFIAYCNDLAARKCGFSSKEELIGKRVSELPFFSKLFNEQICRIFIESDYKLNNIEFCDKAANGEAEFFLNNLFGCLENDNLNCLWVTLRDITEVKWSWQSQKIDALGRLAGGIAHDFNNFLAVIMLHTDMLNLQLPTDSPVQSRISEIKAVTDDAAGMIRQLLAVSRRQSLHSEPVVLNQAVNEFSGILPSIIGEDIRVEFDLQPDLGVCFVDKSQIIQTLINLATNAKKAMTNGGTIRISTANIVLEKEFSKHKSQPSGSYVQITFADNGGGIEEKTMEFIFDPFFTTKGTGKGVGLGLAAIYGFIKQSNGFIWVESQVNTGTTFKIEFPRIDQAEPIKKNKEDFSMPVGDETILLVDDDKLVCNFIAEILKMLGYQVFEMNDGAAALEFAKSFNAPIHLLLTDFQMEPMNGREVSEKITLLHPETKVLFMSGDLVDEDSVHVHFLGKPFSQSELALKVNEVLNLEK